LIPSSDHNEALSGDALYSAFLNHEWREIVLPFIIAGMAGIAASIEDETDRQEFEVRYGALIDDFYNEDTVPANAKSFTVERTTSSGSLASGAWQPINVSIGKNPNGLVSMPSGRPKIAEGGLYSVNLVLNVRNAATAANLKLCRIRNVTQSSDACIGVSQNLASSGIIRTWNAINDIFECNDDDELEFEIFSATSASIIESDGTIGSVVSRCLQATFVKLAE
jgi:hypothetical protein